MKGCSGRNPKKLVKKGREDLLSIHYYNYVEHEYFYSHMDQPYLLYNEFREMLDKVGLKNVTKLKRNEWYIIRKAMGKPRRFSQFFIRQEIKKLNQYREIVRKYIDDDNKQGQMIEKSLKNPYILSEVKKLASF